MREYRDPVSKLFCVTFDNSSVMGKFYKDITDLQKTTIDTIYQKYVDEDIKSTYYYKLGVTQVDPNALLYDYGAYIKVENIDAPRLNRFVFDGKFFMYKAGAFGECVKNSAVRFMVPNEKSSCGMKLVRYIYYDYI